MRVEAETVLGIVRAGDPVAVSLPRTNPGEVAVPNEGRDLVQRKLLLGAVVPEQAQRNALGVTPSACSLYMAKLVPSPVQVAPSGLGTPGSTTTARSAPTVSIQETPNRRSPPFSRPAGTFCESPPGVESSANA